MSKEKQRLSSVDRATGLAIILVVLGHVVARQPPAGNEWYELFKYGIYKFHMPFFMFLSGTVFQHTYKELGSIKEYFIWAQKKAARLLPGFVIIGVVIIFGKIIASKFLHVDNLQTDVLHSFYLLIFKPIQSPAGSLWYIYALFLMYLLIPVLMKLLRNNVYLVTSISLLMHVVYINVFLPNFMMVDAIFQYAFWFSLGMLLHKYHDRFLQITNKYGLLFVGLFLLSFLLVLYTPERVSKFFIGLASIPALFYLIDMSGKRIKRLLTYIATYTFTIYLLNTLVIGFAKGIMLKLMSWDGNNFYVFFFLLSVLGVYAPILVHKYLLDRNRYLSRVFR